MVKYFYMLKKNVEFCGKILETQTFIHRDGLTFKFSKEFLKRINPLYLKF